MLASQVRTLQQQLEEANAKIRELADLADTDPLLGLINRRAFTRELIRTIAEVGRYGLEAHLAYVDLNGLKPVNDSFGHAAGDAVLCHLAHTLSQLIRDSDTMGRLGGDEFGIILTHTDPHAAVAAMERLSRGLEKVPLLWQGHQLPVSFAWGVFELRPGQKVEQVLQEADRAMYDHKQNLKAGIRH
ncbi:GGDEF domain-containing protein [Aquisalinus flavus]|uniref:GGDEF domain-containing protein n=1 Tax=Aquisalinus flavus TaxID=1526572 RepID=UPI00165F59C8|nr:GGDEF domain-containing protein [Aquisalinus flavus]MBD0426979.1 GGDEF domain-containing protein [Aquisalinus flavus]